MLVWTISDEGSRTSDKIFTADGEPGEVLELYSADKELENEMDVDTRWRRLDLMVARWDVVIDLAEFIVHSVGANVSYHVQPYFIRSISAWGVPAF